MKSILIVLLITASFVVIYFLINNNDRIDFSGFKGEVSIKDTSSSESMECVLALNSRKVKTIEQFLVNNRGGWEASYITYAVKIILRAPGVELHVADQIIVYVDTEKEKTVKVKEFDKNTIEQLFGELCKR